MDRVKVAVSSATPSVSRHLQVQCAWDMAAQVPRRPPKGQGLGWLLLGPLRGV